MLKGRAKVLPLFFSNFASIYFCKYLMFFYGDIVQMFFYGDIVTVNKNEFLRYNILACNYG